MSPVGQSNYKYLLLIPVILLIFNSIYCLKATDTIQTILLKEKCATISDLVDMIGAAVDADIDREWYEYGENIRVAVEYIDRLYHVYASVYRVSDGQFDLISDRYYEDFEEFDPFKHPEFMQAIAENDYGDIVVLFKPERNPYINVHIHYRWMRPSPDSGIDWEYLVIAAATVNSINTQIPFWISIGQWVSMIVTFLLTLWLAFRHIRMTRIYNTQTIGTDIRWR